MRKLPAQWKCMSQRVTSFVHMSEIYCFSVSSNKVSQDKFDKGKVVSESIDSSWRRNLALHLHRLPTQSSKAIWSENCKSRVRKIIVSSNTTPYLATSAVLSLALGFKTVGVTEQECCWNLHFGCLISISLRAGVFVSCSSSCASNKNASVEQNIRCYFKTLEVNWHKHFRCKMLPYLSLPFFLS